MITQQQQRYKLKPTAETLYIMIWMSNSSLSSLNWLKISFLSLAFRWAAITYLYQQCWMIGCFFLHLDTNMSHIPCSRCDEENLHCLPVVAYRPIRIFFYPEHKCHRDWHSSQGWWSQLAWFYHYDHDEGTHISVATVNIKTYFSAEVFHYRKCFNSIFYFRTVWTQCEREVMNYNSSLFLLKEGRRTIESF